MALAVGLMSGTSLDGVDAALVEVTGVNEATRVRLIEFLNLPIPSATVARIKEVLSVETSSVDKICSLNFELGYLFAEAAKAVCQKAGIALEELDFVASHGQTIYHIPFPTGSQSASTLQIGEAAVIAEETRTTVVSNLRTRDMALGGQGAPIVPYSEFVLYRDSERTRLLQNIGGIGNITVIPAKGRLEEVVAFDTGPGNMVINALCEYFYGETYDKDGQHAANGQVHPELLAEMMNHPYIRKPYPKTTGREEFGIQYTEEKITKWKERVAPDDFIATATMFTAQSIAENVRPFITSQSDLILGGGGSYNRTLVRMIQEALPQLEVKTQEALGYSADAKEAIAMAILANQTLHHQPSNAPNATGARKPVILGSITYYD